MYQATRDSAQHYWSFNTSEICYWNSWKLALRFLCPLQGSLNPKTPKSSSCLFYSFTDHCPEVKRRRSFWRIISRAGHWMCIRWGTICLGAPCLGTSHFSLVTTIQLQLCKFACVCRISSINCGVGDDMPYLCMYFPPIAPSECLPILTLWLNVVTVDLANSFTFTPIGLFTLSARLFGSQE